VAGNLNRLFFIKNKYLFNFPVDLLLQEKKNACGDE